MWPFQVSRRAAEEQIPPSHESLSPQQPLQPISENESDQDTARFSQFLGFPGERLGIPAVYRIPFMMVTSTFCGFALGAAKGGSTAADRYRAENAHRFPKTPSGWYLYHRTKSYHHIIGSVKEGTRFGLMLTAWVTLFAVTEEVLDRSRGRIFSRRDEDVEKINTHRDAASTVMAAMTTSGIYSWSQGFDQFAAGRIAKMSLKYSLAYGLVQDALATMRGRQPAYVQWIASKVSRKQEGTVI